MRENIGKICAILVTFNPKIIDIKNSLETLIPQVNQFIIVDNGSNKKVIKELKSLTKKTGLLIKNNENKGLATALNIGVNAAIKFKNQWVLTLDHDSVCSSNMIKKMFNAMEVSNFKNVGILAPNYTTKKGLVYKQKNACIIPTTITSGQIVSSETFSKIGFYKEDLFIEGIDHDFCFRALSRGIQTLLIPEVVLKQRIGVPIVKNFFGKKIIISNQKPERYYYLFRNRIYLYKNFSILVPKWIIRNIFMNIGVIIKIILFEKKRLKKILMILKGIIDGISNRFGKIKTKNTK